MRPCEAKGAGGAVSAAATPHRVRRRVLCKLDEREAHRAVGVAADAAVHDRAAVREERREQLLGDLGRAAVGMQRVSGLCAAVK